MVELGVLLLLLPLLLLLLLLVLLLLLWVLLLLTLQKSVRTKALVIVPKHVLCNTKQRRRIESCQAAHCARPHCLFLALAIRELHVPAKTRYLDVLRSFRTPSKHCHLPAGTLRNYC
jgi:hypothetical protein